MSAILQGRIEDRQLISILLIVFISNVKRSLINNLNLIKPKIYNQQGKHGNGYNLQQIHFEVIKEGDDEEDRGIWPSTWVDVAHDK